MASSAVWPLYVAVAALLTGDVAIAALLGGDKVYNLKAPRDVAFDYIVLGGVTEGEFETFVQGGSTLVLTLHLWCAGVDARTCALLYEEVHRVFNRRSIALGAPFAARTAGELRLVDIQPDPSDAYVHGIVRLSLSAIRTS